LKLRSFQSVALRDFAISRGARERIPCCSLFFPLFLLILFISPSRFAPPNGWSIRHRLDPLSHFLRNCDSFDFLHLSFSQLQSPSLITSQRASTEADLMASIRVQGGGGSPQCAGTFQSSPSSCSFHPSLFARFRQYRTAVLGQAIRSDARYLKGDASFALFASISILDFNLAYHPL